MYPPSNQLLDLYRPPTPRRRYDNGVVTSISPAPRGLLCSPARCREQVSSDRRAAIRLLRA